MERKVSVMLLCIKANNELNDNKIGWRINTLMICAPILSKENNYAKNIKHL